MRLEDRPSQGLRRFGGAGGTEMRVEAWIVCNLEIRDMVDHFAHVLA